MELRRTSWRSGYLLGMVFGTPDVLLFAPKQLSHIGATVTGGLEGGDAYSSMP